jgi:hypothetical protein
MISIAREALLQAHQRDLEQALTRRQLLRLARATDGSTMAP